MTTETAVVPETPKVSLRVLRTLSENRERHGLTPDEIAFRLNLSILTVRPRITELSKQGLVVTTGYIRRNASGRYAKTYAIAPRVQGFRW